MNPVHYSPDVETEQPDEQEISERILHRMAAMNRKTFERHQHGQRDAHAKSHALLVGTLRVHDDLPQELAQGIFATPASYEAVARLSSAPSDIHPDNIPAPRGFALKVLDVEGERLNPAISGKNQDFLMVNFPTLAFGDVASYERLLPVLEANASSPAAAQRALAAGARGVKRVLEKGGKPVGATLEGLARDLHHPLGENYFTQGALRFGDYIAKLSLQPASPHVRELSGTPVDVRKPDGMRDAIAGFCREHESSYTLMVQLCTDLESMPVEDAAVRWDEEQSPFYPVATLHFPAQDSEAAERRVYGDDVLSFNPWNGINEHQPLGSIMRIRRQAYENSTSFRHEMNARERTEPERATDVPTGSCPAGA